MKRLLAIPLVLLLCSTTQGQVIWTGLKAGYNLSWVRYDNRDFRNQVDVSPMSGFNAGAAFSFRMKDRYFLHTEVLFSTRGRVVEGPDLLHDEVVYSHIEVPLIYNVHFNGRLKLLGQRYFKWYAGLGPNFSYWLGGRGRISHIEITDFEQDFLYYKLQFGDRPDEARAMTDKVYLKNVNRLQLGVNFGGGLILEPRNGHKFLIDLRFELGHSWIGTSSSTDFLVPASYVEDLRARHLGGRLSVMYMIEYNLDKRVRNKGKSTIKQSKKKRR